MVKKKSSTVATSSASGGAAAKASPNPPKRGAPDAPPPAPAPPAPSSSTAGSNPGDWPASTTTKRDEKKARSLGLIPSDEGNVILPGAISRPNPPAGFTVMFLSFLYRGLSLPAHKFLHHLLRVYEIQLWQLTPNSILHLAVFITLCEAFLGIEPHFGLWKKNFFVKRYNSSGGSFVIGGVGFVVRTEVNYFNFPMRESVQGWRLKWFYIRDSSMIETQLPRFSDVLEAKPKQSWKNTLSSDEKPAVDKLFDKFLQIKEADGQIMIGTEVAAVFLKRRVQPIMIRAHPMWLYSGPKDETRINIAELSEKELLDEVRRLTHFSQEDSIPLISSHPPFDADHPPTGIPAAPEDLRDLPDGSSEGRDSSVPVEFQIGENASPKDERDDPINSEADFTNPPPPANDISDTAGSMRDDDADHAAFIDAAVEEAKASPAKRSSGGFADEDDLFDLDEGFIEPPSKKAKSGAVLPNPAASEASAPAAVPAAQISTATSLSKGRNIPSTAAATTPSSGKPDLRAVISSLETFASQYTSLEADKARLQKEVKSTSSKLEGAIKIAAEARQEVDSLKEELEGLKRRLKDEEASRLAVEAWAIEKDDLLRQSSLALLEAADIPVEALDKLPNNSPANALSMTLASHQLTRDLLQKGKGAMARMHSMIFPKISQDKTLGQLIDAFAVNTKEVIEVFPVPTFMDDSSGAVSESDRLQRMKDRISQMEKDMRSTYALAAIIKRKGDLAADVERYALTELHRATESLNFIALNPAEENRRIHDRVNALTQLSSSDEVFWKEQSKASAVAKFQDRVQQVHRFFDKCYKGLRVIWRTMFPLNAVPPTLLTLMSEFSNTKKIRDLVRAQLFAGTRFTLALVLVRYPSADLLAIANAVGDLEPLYPKVVLPSNIIVDKLEESSKVSEGREIPQG